MAFLLLCAEYTNNSGLCSGWTLQLTKLEMLVDEASTLSLLVLYDNFLVVKQS